MRHFLAVWILVAATALAVRLGGYPLLEPDEGRNGEVGREMAATNDYVLPHLDGLPYLDKPIVYFAAEAAAMEFLGPTETAARLPALLFTLLTAAVVAWFARRVGIDPLLAAILFLAMPLTLAFARTVIFDSALSFFVTVAIVAFYCSCHPERSEGPGGAGGALNERFDAAQPPGPLADARGDKRWWIAVAWAAIAFGVLTKGPVAIAVPLLVAIPYAISRRRFRALWSWTGLVAFVLIIAPWLWGVSRAIPDFLHYVLVTETGERLATKALKRTGPPWYFVPYLIGGAFPWSIAALFGARRPATGDRLRDRFLLLWIVVPFLFFSLSQSKRPQYILPLMPAIALFVASRWNERMARAAAIAVATFGALLLIAGPRVHLRPEFAEAARDAAITLGIAAIAAGAGAFFSRRRDLAIAALTVPILLIPIATNSLMQALATRRSERSLARAVQRYLTPATEIVGIEAFSGSLAFYLQRQIVVVSPDGEEFTSNYLIRHYRQFADSSNLHSPASLPRVFDATRPRIVIVRQKDKKNRALIEANRGTRIAESGHYAAYTIAR